MASTVRISAAAHRSLTQLAKETQAPLQQVLDRAIENERRRFFLERANHAYARLRENNTEWRKWQAELRELDHTVADGI